MILTHSDIMKLRTEVGIMSGCNVWRQHVTDRLGIQKTQGWVERSVGKFVDDALYQSVLKDKDRGFRTKKKPKLPKVPTKQTIDTRHTDVRFCRYCGHPYTFSTVSEHNIVCRQLQDMKANK